MVLIIEDNLSLVHTIKLALLKCKLEFMSFIDGNEGYTDFINNPLYNLIILDLNLPGIDGEEILKKVRKVSDVPIVVISANDSLELRIELLDKGADDFLVKPFCVKELVSRIKAVSRRHFPEDKFIKLNDLTINLRKRTVSRANRDVKLSRIEYELLLTLALNAGNVVTKADLLSKVWGYDHDVSTNIVEVRICHLRNKIDGKNECKLLKNIHGVGYSLTDQ